MNIRTHIRRPRASTVIASLALFVALGGSATAATLITGAKVKNGTITAKDVKNSTLTGSKVKNGSLSASDLSKSAQGSLKGAKGDKGSTGPQGAAGATGTTGAQGPRGIVSPRVVTVGSDAIPNDVDTTILTNNNVPAGSYVVTAKATLETTDGDLMQCNLENGGNSVDQTQWVAPTAADLDSPMMLTAVVNVTNGPLSIVCSKDGTTDGSASNVKLIAVPVG